MVRADSTTTYIVAVTVSGAMRPQVTRKGEVAADEARRKEELTN